MTHYDIIIVGAGIAGLRTALEIRKLNKNLKILLLEKESNPGGRMQTIHINHKGQKFQYESGAGRISETHTKLLKLIDYYGLSTVPIKKEVLWRKYGTEITVQNNFENLWFEICQNFDKLPIDCKRTKTLRDLAIETLGVELAKALLETYAYRAEIEVSSAESAIDLYKTIGRSNFFVLKTGFSSLIDKMIEDAKKREITMKYDESAIRISVNKNKLYTVLSKKEDKYTEFTANRIVLAVPRNALEKIYPFSSEHPLIKAVTMEPLLRIYSVYEDASWFPKSHLVTDSPLRNIIPINSEKGLIMSSYLDSRDIDLWTDLYKKAKHDELKEKVHNHTVALFPEKQIKNKPVFISPEFWRDGCSYWNTGVDYKKLSAEALQPYPSTYPNLHVVGESFSKKPQWIEGALEHADELIAILKSELKKPI